jgi:hypothetical protein
MRDDSTTARPSSRATPHVFNQPYDMGPFWEQVDRRAFDRTLGMQPDVRLLIDHEGQPLARTKSGTLTLSTDDGACTSAPRWTRPTRTCSGCCRRCAAAT